MTHVESITLMVKLNLKLNLNLKLKPGKVAVPNYTNKKCNI